MIISSRRRWFLKRGDNYLLEMLKNVSFPVTPANAGRMCKFNEQIIESNNETFLHLSNCVI